MMKKVLQSDSFSFLLRPHQKTGARGKQGAVYDEVRSCEK